MTVKGKDSDSSQAKVWFNGNWIDQSQVHYGLGDYGFLQGATVVERLRTIGGKFHDNFIHMMRFREGCDSLDIAVQDLPLALPVAPSNAATATNEISRLIQECVEKNPDHQGRDQSIVVVTTPGCGQRPTLLIHSSTIPWNRIATHYSNGQSLLVTSTANVPRECWAPQLKTRARLQYYLADQEAKDVLDQNSHPFAAGLLPDMLGNLTETAAANFLMIEGNCLVSPPMDAILHGVSLRRTLRLASSLGIDIRYEPVPTARAFESDGIILTGTTGCIWSASSLTIRKGFDTESRTFGAKGKELLSTLQEAWIADVGFDFVADAMKNADRK